MYNLCMKRIRLVIAGIPFFNQEEAKSHVRAILRRTGVGNFIEGEDKHFVLELIQRHPTAEEKIGSGIKSLQVVQNPWNRVAQGFDILRADGSRTDISFIKCISTIQTSTEGNLKAAMRRAISNQVIEFKRDQGPSRCGICSIFMEHSHVDHMFHFDFLVANFLKISPSPPTEFDDCPVGNSATFRPQDLEFEIEWSKYHRIHATLRLLCPKCNRSREKYRPE